MQQSQALILMSQMKRIEKDNDIRLSNALYLTEKLKEIPGIVPYKACKRRNKRRISFISFQISEGEIQQYTKGKIY